jgi:hypothetical protein
MIEKSGGPRKLASLKQRAALIPLFSIITGPARTGWDRIRERRQEVKNLLNPNPNPNPNPNHPLLYTPRSGGPDGSGIVLV